MSLSLLRGGISSALALRPALVATTTATATSCRPPLPRARCLHASAPAAALPGIKKKRKVDPAIVKLREERKVRKINKALKKMRQKDRVLRPVVELDVEPHIHKEKQMRTRSVATTEQSAEERALLFKEWNRHCGHRHREELRTIDKVLLSQQKALDQLRLASPALYAKAIEFDPSLSDFSCSGPTRTPPIAGHLVDGQYKDVTKEFVVQYADTKKFMQELLWKPRAKKAKKDEE